MSIPLEVEIGRLLSERKLRLALAESCTGGLAGHRITNVAGSSDYFMGGAVSYSYEAKVAMLGVSWDTLNMFGAVSRETVLEMAHGVKKLLDVDIAASISGIAGPGRRDLGQTCGHHLDRAGCPGWRVGAQVPLPGRPRTEQNRLG